MQDRTTLSEALSQAIQPRLLITQTIAAISTSFLSSESCASMHTLISCDGTPQICMWYL